MKPSPPCRPTSGTRLIGIIGFDGVAALDLVGPLDAFTNAAGAPERYRCRVYGLSRKTFACESGLEFKPHGLLSDAPTLDTVIVPGGAGLRDPSINRPIADWLRAHAPGIRRVVTVCTGIYALAPTGLLDGRRVTTHWRFAADVATKFPALRVEADKIFLQDGRFYTSAGVTAAIDLALWLIEADHGHQLAINVARELVVYLKRSGGQEQYSSPLQLQSRSGDLAPLTTWMANNLARSLSVEVLSERAHLSPRQLHRRFVAAFGQPVGEVVERLRLDAARERLTEYAYPIETVARLVGFQSADVFCRAFVRRYGTCPSDYRDRFVRAVDGAPRAQATIGNRGA
jgi:transcriptional regulator GlxA family with amidase domain